MVNAFGCIWLGVGGIEAEAAMLGSLHSMLISRGHRFPPTRPLSEGATATDLVLTVTEMLRRRASSEIRGVLRFGTVHAKRSGPRHDCQHGARVWRDDGILPRDSGKHWPICNSLARSAEQDRARRAYCKEQMLFRTDQTARALFNDTLELDLGTVEPTVLVEASQDRVRAARQNHPLRRLWKERQRSTLPSENNGDSFDLSSGAVVIAAIQTATNTSNPSLMLARACWQRKRSSAACTSSPGSNQPCAGSKVVTDYLQAAGLTPYLEKLNFIWSATVVPLHRQQRPLPDAIGAALKDNNLIAVAVLSGNRILKPEHPLVRANYLASPPLVVLTPLRTHGRGALRPNRSGTIRAASRLSEG